LCYIFEKLFEALSFFSGLSISSISNYAEFRIIVLWTLSSARRQVPKTYMEIPLAKALPSSLFCSLKFLNVWREICVVSTSSSFFRASVLVSE